MPKIITMGEVLIDFTPIEVEGEKNVVQQNAGGSPANVAVQASKLGGDCGFIGKVGKDKFGMFLKEMFAENNVNAKGLIIDEKAATTLAFIGADEEGKRTYNFYRNPGADTLINYSEVDFDLIDNCEIFHFGSLSLTDEPSRSAVTRAVEYAKSKGKIISYDPNYRESLWTSEESAIDAMKSVLQYVDILKLSEDEMRMLTDSEKLIQGIAVLIKMGVKVVIVTQGPRGCIVAGKGGIEVLPTYDVNVIDTLGAGDSFFGAFLYKLSESEKNFADMTIRDYIEFADFANACGALTSAKYGGIKSMPNYDEVIDCMANVKKLK